MMASLPTREIISHLCPVGAFTTKLLTLGILNSQGVLHAIVDAQREYNKSKSNAMHYMLSSIHSGWIMIRVLLMT